MGKRDDHPNILFAGHSRCGKDTGADYLCRITMLTNAGSLSWAGKEYVAHRLGCCPMTAWENRHRDRMLWRQFLDEYRANDPARLIRDAYRLGRIVTGVRARAELDAARSEGIVQCVIWVERDVPNDPTLEIRREHCNHAVMNDGTIENYFAGHSAG